MHKGYHFITMRHWLLNSAIWDSVMWSAVTFHIICINFLKERRWGATIIPARVSRYPFLSNWVYFCFVYVFMGLLLSEIHLFLWWAYIVLLQFCVSGMHILWCDRLQNDISLFTPWRYGLIFRPKRCGNTKRGIHTEVLVTTVVVRSYDILSLTFLVFLFSYPLLIS